MESPISRVNISDNLTYPRPFITRGFLPGQGQPTRCGFRDGGPPTGPCRAAELPSDEEGIYQRNHILDGDPELSGAQIPAELGLGPDQCIISGTINEYGDRVGADLRNRFVDGVRTDEALFDAETGFPCGAVVEGLNDGEDGRLVCTNFHEAINASGACLDQD